MLQEIKKKGNKNYNKIVKIIKLSQYVIIQATYIKYK